MAFTDSVFDVFVPYTVWWTMNESMLQEKLNAIEKRIHLNIASTKDLHLLYRVAFYDTDVAKKTVIMENSILSRMPKLCFETLETVLELFTTGAAALDPRKTRIRNLLSIRKKNTNNWEGPVSSFCALMWFWMEYNLRSDFWENFKFFVDDMPFKRLKEVDNMTIRVSELRACYFDKVKVEYEGKIYDATVQKNPDGKGFLVTYPKSGEEQTLSTKEAVRYIKYELNEPLIQKLKAVRVMEPTSYSCIPMNLYTERLSGFAQQAYVQLSQKVDGVYKDVHSMQLYDVKTVVGIKKICMLVKSTDQQFSYTKKDALMWIKSGVDSIKPETMGDFRTVYESWDEYTSRYVYTKESFELIKSPNEAIINARRKAAIDKRLTKNADSEDNKLYYRFGKMLKLEITVNSLLERVYQHARPPAIPKTLGKNAVTDGMASIWAQYFKSSKVKSSKGTQVEKVHDHITKMHNNLYEVLKKLDTFLANDILKEKEGAQAKLNAIEDKLKQKQSVNVAEKKQLEAIIAQPYIMDYNKKCDENEINTFLETLKPVEKQYLIFFLLGYQTSKRTEQNDYSLREELSDRVQKNGVSIFPFTLYPSFLENVFEEMTITRDALFQFQGTDKEKRNRESTSTLATKYPVYYFNPDVNSDPERFFAYNGADSSRFDTYRKLDLNLKGIPWSDYVKPKVDEDYWLAFESYRTCYFFWKELYCILKYMLDQCIMKLDLQTMKEQFYRKFILDRIDEQLVETSEFQKYGESYSERTRLTIFKDKIKNQIATWRKEIVSLEIVKEINEMLMFALVESQKRINADVVNSYPMYDQEVMALAEELLFDESSDESSDDSIDRSDLLNYANIGAYMTYKQLSTESLLTLVVVFGDTRVRARKQFNVNNKGNASVNIQLENVNNDKIGPELQVDTNTTPQQLKSIIKEVYKQSKINIDTTKIQHIFIGR